MANQLRHPRLNLGDARAIQHRRAEGKEGSIGVLARLLLLGDIVQHLHENPDVLVHGGYLHSRVESPEQPYLSLRLDLDPALVGSVMAEAGYHEPQRRPDVRAINVSPLDGELLDAVVRLVRLLASPADARFLQPLLTREIVYRLLQGEQGGRLRQLVGLGGTVQRIAPAIERLKQHYDQPVRIAQVARELGMSVSSFHYHFQAVTAMSPLQFQKQLRLQEARRLMLGEGYDASTAGFRVGYNDASHFNREYKRLFGAPPMRDVARMRDVAIPDAGV